MIETSFVLEPSNPLPSRQGRWLAFAVLPWGIGVLLVAYATEQLLGSSPSSRPVFLTWLVAAIAVLPALIWIAGNAAGPRGMFRAMYRSPQPQAVIGREGLEFHGLGTADRSRFDWEAIGSLDKRSLLRFTRTLRAPDGTRLCDIPEELVVGRLAGTNRQMLMASAVVAMRPDRYVLEHPLGFVVLGGFHLR